MGDQDFLLFDDQKWQRLHDLTKGEAAACYQCGSCTAVCPWGLVSDNGNPVRMLVRQGQIGFPQDQPGDYLWLCTTCGQCHRTCPRGVDISSLIRSLRHFAWQERRVPEGFPSLLWSIYWNNNPWSQPPSSRAGWSKELRIPTFNPDEHEILLYVGCTSSFDRRLQKVAEALTRVMISAGVAFGYLGEDEPCCGEAALNSGNQPFFQELAQVATAQFEGAGVRRLVTVSPHCYDVFKNHYADTYPGFEAIHYTQFLASLLQEKRLKFTSPIRSRGTYHDPCYLARHNDLTGPPRQILGQLPGFQFVEMEHSGPETICCGGGGGRMWLETDPNHRLSDLRIKEATNIEANLLVTSCPFCVTCLEDSVKSTGNSELKVLDLAEVVLMSLNE